MANIDKRLNYFNGQFLQDVDFKAEQDYHVDRERRHNRLMHTFGIAEGLNVNAAQGAQTVGVTPGSALDGQGRQIVVVDARTLQLGPQQTQFLNKNVLVVVSYAESTSDKASVGGSGDTRTWEYPTVQIVIDDGTAPAPDTALRLARLHVDNGGLVSGSLDLSVRATAGARVGSEVDAPILKLATPGVDASLWPTLTSNSAGEIDLTGNLVVSGTTKLGADLGVTGKVTATDFLAGTGSLAAHLADKTNPHATTAAQVGAITGVGGVTSAGGIVNLVQGGAILITPDNSANKRITISENHSTNTNNPHSTTALQVGAITGVGGVTNPGGLVNLAQGGAIVLTPDNGVNKRIVISESHSTLTNNPHATTAAQVGAVALTDYDIGKRTLTSFSFGNADVDGSTKTIPLGFNAHLVWVSGYVFANLPGGSIGGPLTGLSRLDGGIGGYVIGPFMQRLVSAPYILPSVASGNGIARGLFFDNTVSPSNQIDLSVSISSVTTTGLVVTFNRSTTAGSVAPGSFNVFVALLCLGN